MPSPAGASGGTASVYLPPGQSGAAAALGQIAQPLIDLSMYGGAGTPGAWAYPQSQDIWGKYLYPGNEPGQMALGGAYDAANYGNTLFPMMTGYVPGLAQSAAAGLPMAQEMLAQGFDPAYQAIVDQAANLPGSAEAYQAALTAAGQGQQGAASMMGMADSLMNAGYDPQSALFNRSQQSLMDQMNAANAAAGVGGSPYGAGVTGQAMSNFDINWQNQQLARQAQAAQAASPLYQAAPQLEYMTGQMPLGVQQNLLSILGQALQQREQAALRGAGGYSSLLGSAAGGLQNAENLGATTASTQAQLQGLPYSTSATLGSNALSGLNTTTNLGNNQYLLPQQMMQNLMQYMGLGQNASVINGQLGQMGFNQTAQGLGGALAGANALFGTNSLLGGSSGLFGSGGLFGAPAAAAGTTAASSGGLLGGLGSIAPLALS